jgi:acyl carrier protein
MTEAELLAMKRKVQRLIFLAAGGRIAEETLAEHTVDLRQIGLDSLGYLNLLEGLERTFDVVIDLEREPDHTFLHTIDNIVNWIVERRGAPA